MGVVMILAMNLRTPNKSPVWTFLPGLGVSADCEAPARDVLSWLGWLETILGVGGLSIPLLNAKLQLKKGRAVSFLPLFCISCHDSLWLCRPCLVRVPCGFRYARRYLLPIKTKFQSVEKHTSQWDSEMFCVSNAFQALMVLSCFLDTLFIEAAIFSICGFLKDRAHLTVAISNCLEDFMFLLHRLSLNNCGFKYKHYEFQEGRNFSWYQPVKSS